MKRFLHHWENCFYSFSGVSENKGFLSERLISQSSVSKFDGLRVLLEWHCFCVNNTFIFDFYLKISNNCCKVTKNEKE